MISININILKTAFLAFILSMTLTLQVNAQEGKDYNSVIQSADEYFAKKDYVNAKAAYQLATSMKPEEAYPKDKIQEIIAIFKAEMQVRGQYGDWVEQADEDFENKKYADAIGKYEQALALISYEEYPKKQIEEAKRLMEAASLKQSAYEQAIQSADALFEAQDYEKALSMYSDASTVDASQAYPQEQIAKIRELVKQQAQNQQAYDNAILKGDQQLNYQKFVEALAEYENALAAKPGDAYASQQVTQMKEFIQLEKQYDQIAAQADELYVSKDLQAAKAQYQKAMSILPQKTYAANMIAKIDANLDKELAKKQKLEEDYQKAIADGDELFNTAKYQAAYSKYSKALELKPNEAYPRTQLEEIDILLATGYLEISLFVHENDKGLFDSRAQLIENGTVIETAEIGSNGRYKLKLELNKNYQLKVFKQDYIQKLFSVNTSLPRSANHNNIYTSELPVELFKDCATDLSLLNQPLIEFKYYENKGNFFYDEQKAQIIINKVNDLKLECEKIRKEQASQEEYDEFIAQADKDFEQKKYADALENYSSALLILPEEVYPKQKQEEINKILAEADKYQALITSGDAKYNAKDYENALYDYYAAKNMKPNEVYPQEKIDEIDAILNAQKALDANYLAQVKTADSLFSLDSLLMAKSAYELALNIKKEEYPQTKIKEIESALKKQAEIQKKYEEAIANADKLYERENLADARAAYLIASQIKPNEMYPKYKIEDINTIEEQRKLKALNDNYEGLIAQADEAFNGKNYTSALALYGEAGKMKPKENYPPAQIALINELLGELAAKDQQYNDLIAAADLAFGNKNYAPSFDDYKAASLLKPEESYPKEKMAEIEQIMKELADLEMAYNEAIKSGDEQFELKSWTESLGFYQTAKGLKPEEAYPQQKIDEINALLQNLADQDAAYEQAIAQGDQNFESENWQESKTAYQTALGIKPQEEYPASQIALIDQKLGELAQLKEQYDALIKEGDALFAAKNYIESKSKFQQAGTLQPQEAYPPQKIAEIDLLLKDLADQDAAYDQAIAQGDQYFESENWNESKASYQTALGIKPQEEYPAAQIALIDEKLGAIAAQDQQYNDLIAAADLAFESKNYSPSLEDYKAASLVKPEESYPKERIAEIEQIMKELADLELAYNEAIKSGDEQFELKSWTESLGFYQTAKGLKPEETYPQQKIDEINALLQNLADQDAAYEQAIAQGDQNFESENWQESKTAYQTALGIKSQEEYPASQIALIDQKLGELAQLKAQYDALVKEGDDLFVAKNYIESKSKFQQAGSLQPQEAYPPQKIAEIDLLLQELADLDASYNNAIAQADLLFGEKNWTESIAQYQVALGLKPAEQYPKDQIADIEAFLETMRERDAQYTQLIEEADGHRDQENYESALTKYQAALNIKKEEVYPQEQIDLINARLKEMADQEALYLSLIATGDEQFAAQTYAPALSSFQQASSLKPEEQYPKDKIAEIQSILDQFAETDRLYAEAIALADQNRDQEVWQNALAKYQEASGIKPEEAYPKQQIDFVNQKIKELAELQAAYEAAITKADQEFEAKDWQNALSSYQSALSLKPEETHPQSRITEINGILKEMADLDAAYQLAISEADGFFKGNDWNASLEKYQQASNLKPAEQYPKDKITELNNILGEIAAQQAKYDAFIQQADQLFAAENWESSKEKYQSALGVLPEEVYPKNQMAVIDEKLAAIAALQQQYEALIEEADRQFSKEIWQEALVQYQQAATLMPEEVYPKDQIAIVNQKIQELADQQAQYDALVAQADQLYESVKYPGAIAKYEEALLIYPKEEYPASQIRMINKLLAEIAKKREEYSKLVAEGDGFFENKDYLKAQSVYSQAREIFADSIYPQNQLGLIADLLQIQENYKALIEKGDEQFANKEYEASLQSFKDAHAIYNEEAYPEQKIEEIEKILSMIAMTKAAYDQFILDADAHFTAEEYPEAKADYQLAIEQLPNEDYPRQKIMEIDRILADIARKKAQFDNIIAQANQSFDKKEYETSLTEYQEALSILPEEAYPQQRITEIKELLALIADKQKHFDVLVQQGDQAFENAEYQKSIDLFTEANEVLPNELYPPKRIAEARSEMERIQMEIDMAYSKAIAAGDRGFNQEEWEEAKLQYQSAIDIKPEELYPKEKLAEINKIQEELLLAQQRAYDEHIANGERFYSTKYYDESMIAFESALEIYPDQDYPKEMIEKLKILIEKSAIITLIDQETRMFQDSKYDYKYKPVNYKNKNDSYILIEVKPLTNNETKVYLSFGNSGTTNGEYYIYLDNKQEYKKYYVVLGDNYKWLSNSNNFLKVIPEGGSVDVKLLQISRN